MIQSFTIYLISFGFVSLSYLTMSELVTDFTRNFTIYRIRTFRTSSYITISFLNFLYYLSRYIYRLLLVRSVSLLFILPWLHPSTGWISLCSSHFTLTVPYLSVVVPYSLVNIITLYSKIPNTLSLVYPGTTYYIPEVKVRFPLPLR